MPAASVSRRRAVRFLAAMSGAFGALASIAALAAAGTGLVDTVAGGVGAGLPLKTAQAVGAIATHGTGQVYVADAAKGVIRRLAGSPPKEVVVAGNGTDAFSGDGGPAASAGLSEPRGVAVGVAGNLVIADSGHNRVRVVPIKSGTFYGVAMTVGNIYTVAGDGTAGFAGDGGPATSAELQNIQKVAVDPSGNIAVADVGNQRVRVVAAVSGRFFGVAMTAGHIYTVAGGGTSGVNGVPATAAALGSPNGIAIDAHRNLVIAEFDNNDVRVVAAGSGTFYGAAMTVGHIYRVAGSGAPSFSGDGGPALDAAMFWPVGVAVDGAGNLLIADTYNSRVRVVAAAAGTYYGVPMTAGDIYTAAGGGSGADGGRADAAALAYPADVAADPQGNLLIADTQDSRLRVAAGAAGTFYGVAMADGNIYSVAGNGMYSYSGDDGPATSAELFDPSGVGLDAHGSVLVADQNNNVVRVVARSTGTFYGVAMTSGDIYRVAGGGASAADGVPARSARLISPSGVAADSDGNLLIADSGDALVRVVAGSTGTFYGAAMTAGDIYTVAGGGASSGSGVSATTVALGAPAAVATDAKGNVVVVDSGGNLVRVVADVTGTSYGVAMTAGDIYTVAGTGTAGFSGDGGPASAAGLKSPSGVAVDATGNLLVADTSDNRVRAIAAATGRFYGVSMTAGDIYTIAGRSAYGFAGDGGRATSAELNKPGGVALDVKGNLVIADTDNNRVRVVATAAGTFFGVAMTAGDIYSVAGTGTAGFSGDGGQALATGIAFPGGVVVGPTGNLLIADSGNDRIRRVIGP